MGCGVFVFSFTLTSNFFSNSATQGKARLAEISQMAEADGVFGVPFMALHTSPPPSAASAAAVVSAKAKPSSSNASPEPFFGADRIDALRKTLLALGLKKPSAAAAAEPLPSKL